MEERTEFIKIIEKLHEEKRETKEELKQLIITECENYGDVEKYLNMQKKQAYWVNDELAILIITELVQEFNKDKNNLPL
ncbi:TPA: hypothetical protein QCU33_001584 [Bacillus cereus]|nr:hypothetical protein [Bacillus cereus]